MRIDFVNIIAVDPGQTTGVAMQIVSPDEQQRLVKTTTADTPETIFDLVANYKWEVVVCENFATAGRMSKYGLYTVRIVGGIQALCHYLKIPLAMRQPQNRTAFQDDAAKYLMPTKHVIHEVDALAHLLAWKYFQANNKE